ncbi:MAG: threonylcarbamoyl-AMP synthase [Alphaproteobacteria bacterium]|nr:threonylcarbamoyl-AMP synthase [Alphaproteobacteria bacterium]
MINKLKTSTAGASYKAANILNKGGIVAFPTETVYGLGADARNEEAVLKVFRVKKRPSFNPLIIHLADIELAKRQAEFNALAIYVAEVFWPGPLTLVLPRASDCNVSRIACAGLKTLALRVPENPAAQDLLTTFSGPIAAPSANISGSVSPTRADHISDSLLDKTDLILDGGPCKIGLESTVLDLTVDQPRILRHGAIPLESLIEKLGDIKEYNHSSNTEIKSPGLLRRHYATNQPLRLNAITAQPNEAYLAFGDCTSKNAAIVRNLSESGDLSEAANKLFLLLRELDMPKYESIAVAPIPNEGLGRAINDRLERAAVKS